MQGKFFAAVGVVAMAMSVLGLNAQERPKIMGVSHIAVYASDMKATEHYYTDVLGARKALDPENAQGARYFFSPDQYVEVLPLPTGTGKNRLDHIAFLTSNADGMRKYLAARGWHTPAEVKAVQDGGNWFDVFDPEGNRVQFAEPVSRLKSIEAPRAISHHIIHVGILIHDRATEDTFYRELLGFRPYWYGGMQDNKLDWVSQQVPDGHDWLEYMVAGGPGKGIPDSMSQQTLGVLDHFALGEASVPDEYKKLVTEKRLGNGRHDQGPKIGKDGKWQFNMYDPDGIRAELMNFHATEKPCCSAFTADDPAE